MTDTKTVIIYASSHHGNTKKLIDAIASEYPVEMIDIILNNNADICEYDRIGIAAGVAYGKYYPQMLEYLKVHMPSDKEVFFIHTAGYPRENHNAVAKEITDARGCKTLGTFFCKGFNTYGPFKLIGGINKNRPNDDDFTAVKKFYAGL